MNDIHPASGSGVVALAQIRSLSGDIPTNTDKHLLAIRMASRAGASAIFFPELSLSAYEPTLAEGLAMDPSDIRLRRFQALATSLPITIGLGVPVRTEKGIHISMAIFQPDVPWYFYHKQLLHEDEEAFFVPGAEKQILIPLAGPGLEVSIAPAICYESLQPTHAATAFGLGADLYLASVAKNQQGVQQAVSYFSALARQYQCPVLMVNAIGPSDDFLSAGQSAFWSADGQLIGQLDGNQEGILLADLWTGAQRSIPLHL